jgi:hypothetical protein
MQYYKKAFPDGWDFYTGKTINYRENIGKTVKVPNPKGKPTLCSNNVLHASQNPNCFIGAKIPCSIFIVHGKPVVKDPEKAGFRALKIIEEIPESQFNDLLGWRYSEAINPLHPFKISPPQKVAEQQINLLRVWASVWDSVGDSDRASVRASVGASVGASVWDSVGASVRDSVGASVWASVGASVRDSVRAYIGSLFPNIKQWRYIKHEDGKYPFQPCVELWKMGLIPSFDGVFWRLHGGEKATVLFSISKAELTKK